MNKILICSNNCLYDILNHSLVIGKKYELINIFPMQEKKIVEVRDIETNECILYDEKGFISIDVYREFQLRKILNDESK